TRHARRPTPHAPCPSPYALQPTAHGPRPTPHAPQSAMLTRRIIPCLDVTGGRVVKGTQFLNLRDAGDPVELAAYYDAEGADELTFYDITASSDERETMLDVVRRTARRGGLHARRAAGDRPRRGRVGAARGGVGRGRDCPEQH